MDWAPEASLHQLRLLLVILRRLWGGHASLRGLAQCCHQIVQPAGQPVVDLSQELTDSEGSSLLSSPEPRRTVPQILSQAPLWRDSPAEVQVHNAAERQADSSAGNDRSIQLDDEWMPHDSLDFPRRDQPLQGQSWLLPYGLTLSRQQAVGFESLLSDLPADWASSVSQRPLHFVSHAPMGLPVQLEQLEIPTKQAIGYPAVGKGWDLTASQSPLAANSSLVAAASSSAVAAIQQNSLPEVRMSHLGTEGNSGERQQPLALAGDWRMGDGTTVIHPERSRETAVAEEQPLILPSQRKRRQSSSAASDLVLEALIARWTLHHCIFFLEMCTNCELLCTSVLCMMPRTLIATLNAENEREKHDIRSSSQASQQIAPHHAKE